MLSKAAWATTPVILPPAGQTSNLIDPPSIGNQFMIANIVGGVVVNTIVALRLYTQSRIIGSLNYDDCK